jgi:uncharacterized protein (UPF0297 family)
VIRDEIIETLKAQYSRDLRKQLVKSLLESEKNSDTEQQYKLINQIFSYVISELGWTMAANTENWDNSPLNIMSEVFPKLKTSKWYLEQNLSTKRSIDVVIGKTK